ncbi:UNVERIFIED_CONTAM: Peptidyl-prolyl cis-trans isomerase cyp10 [Siphonaria sp. JEL0065]|nr:Peptidyl-prolyl cis-trans isomerase cyp10 [Siphonaria sp. JEL0065]
MSLTLHTDLGDLKVEIFCEAVPRTAENFIALAASGYYNNNLFHRNIKGFMVQTGDPTGTGKGGQSIYGQPFPDEIKSTLKHNTRGILSMANKGPDTNKSQFFITYGKHSHLDSKYTVFGKVIDGMDTLDAIEKVPVESGSNRPLQDRCARRGIPCIDGQRKRAKYLELVPGAALIPPTNSGSSSSSNLPSATASNAPTNDDLFFDQKFDSDELLSQANNSSTPPNTGNIPNTNPLLSHNGFGSESINNEFSFLSNMLDANTNATTHLHLQSHNFATDGLLPPHQAAQPTGVVMDLARNDILVRKAKRVYREVVRPYDYREGYHYLVKYIAERMEKQDIMRICGSLAKFRPSFMAVIMNLSEEDLVFMEKCFQRTLIEYEKLITYSGTPTVVWRRSGEISLVGKEFCLLTDWPHETLIPSPTSNQQSTYIYQLMDAKSVIEYWERFATAAFDKNCSWMVKCVLVSPTGRNIPCSVCFTIKRDIFDVPLAVIGNFLPLFQARKE